MNAIITIDGTAHTIGPRASKMIEWLLELDDRIESADGGTIVLRFNQGAKVFADFSEQCGVKRY